jgi:hypothetical protein
VFRDDDGSYSSWISSDVSLLQTAKKALDAQDVSYHEGDVITAWKVIGSPAEKGRLGATSGGQVVDMEARWIAGVAQEKGVPFLLARAVIDPTSLAVPGLIGRVAGYPKWAQWLSIGFGCLLTPWNVPSLLELKRNSEVAAASLARFVEAFLKSPQLGSREVTTSTTGDNGR